jgi:flagellar hook-basal body complex protein FliE
MAIEAIAALSSAIEPASAQVEAPVRNAASTFGNWFTGEMAAVNGKLVGAEHAISELATGNVQNLHQVMIQIEEAQLSFQLLMQVRNHALEAYQEVMRTQV